MAIITLLSASGSPGTTTTAVALALSWPRPVILLDADPSASAAVLAGYLRGEQRRDAASVADLAIALRTDEIEDSLPAVQIPLSNTVSLIPGPKTLEQVKALHGLWQPLATALAEQADQGVDVIVDAGRLGLAGHPAPLVQASDLVLLVSRCTIPAVAGMYQWAEQLRNQFAELGVPDAVGLLLLGTGHIYSAAEVRDATHTPVYATLPLDPVTAEVYSLGNQPGLRHDRSPLAKALPAAVEAITSRLHRQAESLMEVSHD